MLASVFFFYPSKQEQTEQETAKNGSLECLETLPDSPVISGGGDHLNPLVGDGIGTGTVVLPPVEPAILPRTRKEDGGNGSISGRCWCCTINRPERYIIGEPPGTQINNTIWHHLRLASCNFVYAIFQLERASTGKLHLQGYVEYTSAVSFRKMQKILPGAHLELRRGTRDSAREYCRKADTRVAGPWEDGEWRSTNASRKRLPNSDLEEVRVKIAKGTAEKEIASDYFNLWVRHYRAFERFGGLTCESRNKGPEVYVLAGMPGTGKSTFARQLGTPSYHKAPTKWWDGYVPVQGEFGHKVVIFDDYAGSLTWTDFKLLCDEAPYRVEVKGGTLEFNSPIIVFTTNKNPLKWYKWEHDPHAHLALKRRVTHWLIFEKVENDFKHYDYGGGEKGWHDFNEHLSQIIPSSVFIPDLQINL